MKCQERAGFLIPRPCVNDSTVACPLCKKPVCGDHTAPLIHGGLACTSCAAGKSNAPAAQARGIRDYYGYHPNAWGYGWSPGSSSFGYTDSDYRAFEAQDIADSGGGEQFTGS
jgi:hypothetical protein